MDVRGAVEAALFSSSDPLTVREIAERISLPVQEVRTAVMDLRRGYDDRDSAIMIAKIGTGYRMMLRTGFSQYTGRFARAEMTGGMMRTLSTIAYNQPLLQSELFKTRGARTYDDVRALIGMDMVAGRRSGQTLELTTTPHFAEYFGIGSTKVRDIRAWIEEHAKNL